jgi:hypothetical protein
MAVTMVYDSLTIFFVLCPSSNFLMEHDVSEAGSGFLA